MGHLAQRAGDFVRAPGGQAKSGRRRAGNPFSASAQLLIDLAKGNGKNSDPLVRQDLVKLYTLGELGRYNGLRQKALRSQGKDLPGVGNIAKLSMSEMMRVSRDLGLRIVGPAGTLHAYEGQDGEAVVDATGNPFLPIVTGTALFAQGPAIYGGTDQIQRNIIGERVLGLPKEPNNDKTLPFSELPKNA